MNARYRGNLSTIKEKERIALNSLFFRLAFWCIRYFYYYFFDFPIFAEYTFTLSPFDMDI